MARKECSEEATFKLHEEQPGEKVGVRRRRRQRRGGAGSSPELGKLLGARSQGLQVLVREAKVQEREGGWGRGERPPSGRDLKPGAKLRTQGCALHAVGSKRKL